MANDGDDQDIVHVPLSGTRGQTLQRLQIGLSGLAAMVLLVGLANIILDRVKQTDAHSVPEAAASVAANPSAANDPLADAGVAPEVQVAPTPAATPPPAHGNPDAVAPSGE